jgi:hypothetical protein
MSAAAKRLRDATSLMGQALDLLQSSLPLTPENKALLDSIRRDRQFVLDRMTAMARQEATR